MEPSIFVEGLLAGRPGLALGGQEKKTSDLRISALARCEGGRLTALSRPFLVRKKSRPWALAYTPDDHVFGRHRSSWRGLWDRCRGRANWPRRTPDDGDNGRAPAVSFLIAEHAAVDQVPRGEISTMLTVWPRTR